MGHRPGTELRWQATRQLWFQADYGIFYFLKETQPGGSLNYWALWAGYNFYGQSTGSDPDADTVVCISIVPLPDWPRCQMTTHIVESTKETVRFGLPRIQHFCNRGRARNMGEIA